MREQLLRDNVAELRSQKDKLERDLKAEMMSERADLQRQLGDMKERLVNSEESSKDLERTKLFGTSEFEKEEALLA